MSYRKTNPEYTELFKVILVGDSETGKTNILSRFTRNEFTQQVRCTIGVEFGTKIVSCDGRTINVQAWDTAGQERYMAITKSYYRGCVGAMIIYDVSNRQSFENVAKWLEEIKEYNTGVYDESTPVIVIGNKCDIQNDRAISTEEGTAYAKENGLCFIETSAKENTNINEAFEILCRAILKNVQKEADISAPKRNQSLNVSCDKSDDRYFTETPEDIVATATVDEADDIPEWGQELIKEVIALGEKVDALQKLETKVDTLSERFDKLESKLKQFQPKPINFKTAQARSVKR